MQKVQQNQIISVIIVAGFIIAGAVLLKGSTRPITEGRPVISSGTFSQCLDSGKHANDVALSTSGGKVAGVNSTPKVFILKSNKVVDVIDGAIPTDAVKQKLDAALAATGDTGTVNPNLEPAGSADFVLGNDTAPITLIEYADFQCPFCGKFFHETEKNLLDSYIQQGKIKFVHRDFTFLGTFVQPYVLAQDESVNAAQAARCAADQGKFWEYHDYLYSHQNGENQGNFSTTNLKSFAKVLGLN